MLILAGPEGTSTHGGTSTHEVLHRLSALVACFVRSKLLLFPIRTLMFVDLCVVLVVDDFTRQGGHQRVASLINKTSKT